MKYKLKILSKSDDTDIFNMLQQIPYDENGFINSIKGKTFEEYKSWLLGCYENAQQKEIIDGWKVPQTTFWFFVDGEPIGFGKIRHLLTDNLRHEGGTLGYSICPTQRGKGYGKVLLSEMLKECKIQLIDNLQHKLITYT